MENLQLQVADQTPIQPAISEAYVSPKSEKERLAQEAVEFATYLNSRYPQVDNDQKVMIEIDDGGQTVELPELPEGISLVPRINYYFAGSLATMLLSQAEIITDVDSSSVPLLVEGRRTTLSTESKAVFLEFARQIGDLDYVPFDHYKQNPNKLRKGGGGPSFDEIPEGAIGVLKRGEGQIKVMCDPVEAYGERRVSKVIVDGKEFLIARPDTIIAYKCLHLLQNFAQKPDKFNTDFQNLYTALQTLYTEDELLEVTRSVLVDYEDSMEALHRRLYEDEPVPKAYAPKIPAFIERVIADERCSDQIRGFLQKIKTD